ncbi:MOSC domain-containing protein [Ekhidna sp.]
MAPSISNIRIYPIKSLDPVELQEVEIGVHSLKNDRIFAMIAEDGRYVNGKRTGRVNQLHSKFDLDNKSIQLTERGLNSWEVFELRADNLELQSYLQDFFDMKLRLEHNEQGELLDIPRNSSVTVVSEASLLSLQKDFPTLSIEDLRLRFRTNIELTDVDAYWEEQLFNTPQSGIRFRMGEVECIGMSPRARCNVPPRNPMTGETDKSFVKTLIKSRAENLPEESTLGQFGNFYHLTVDTYLPPTETGKILKTGDKVEILETVQFQ